MTDIIEKLNDLHKQATTERSHYYVASCSREAIAEIESLRQGLRKVKHADSLQEVLEIARNYLGEPNGSAA